MTAPSAYLIVGRPLRRIGKVFLERRQFFLDRLARAFLNAAIGGDQGAAKISEFCTPAMGATHAGNHHWLFEQPIDRINQQPRAPIAHAQIPPGR